MQKFLDFWGSGSPNFYRFFTGLCLFFYIAAIPWKKEKTRLFSHKTRHREGGDKMNRNLGKRMLGCFAAAVALTSLTALAGLVEAAPAAQADKIVVNEEAYRLPYAGPEEAFRKGILPGYGSSLALKEVRSDGSLDFWCITDRGPNGDIPTYVKNGKKVPGKFFPTPDFTPSIGILRVRDGKASLVRSLPLRDAKGQRISGKVVPRGAIGSTGEVALDFSMKDLGTDTEGLDTEGIAVGKDGNLWLCDEYGPFLLKVDKRGKILAKYGPGAGLPAILAQRVPNRGFEGVTVDENGYIYGMVQSPLDVNGKTKKTARYTRIVRLNPDTEEVTMFAYPVDTGYKNFGAAKLGDITSIGNGQFLIIEQGKQRGAMQNLIYKVDLRNATPVDESGSLEQGMLPQGFRPATKELVLDLRAHGWNIEKAEGLALLPDRRTLAVVNDNDFGIAVGINDPDHANTTLDDYQYDASTGKTIFKKDGTASRVQFYLTQNAPEEQQDYICFFSLDHKL
jgi:hypothetical protein